MSNLVKKEDNTYLTDSERKELNDYIATGKGYNIAPAKAQQFFSLYLEGRSIAQINAAHPQWPKGALQLARHQYLWDKKKEEYLMELFNNVRSRMLKLKAEVANHIMDKLTVAHKEFASGMEQYLVNPDATNLPKTRLKNMREYKDAIVILKELLNMSKMAEGDDPLKQSAPSGANITINVNTKGDKVEAKVDTDESKVDTDESKDKAEQGDIIDVESSADTSQLTTEEQSTVLKELVKIKKGENTDEPT